MLNKRILILVFVVAFLTLLVGCFPSPAPPITENQAPIITSDPVTTAKVGKAYTYDVNATDPDGDILTYSLTVAPKGMTIDSATGVINWKPVCGQLGDKSVVVEVSDGALSATQGFTIKVSGASYPPGPPPVNHAPIITSVPNLTAIVGVEYTYTITATDPDGDVLTYSLVSGPAGMTFVAPATISWTPVLGQVGPNDITVEVSDGKLSVPQSFAVVVVENQPPTADAGPDRIVVMETPVEITFIGAGTDPDGTVVSYSWDFGDSGTGTGATVGHTYSALGAYTVTLTVMDNGGATDPDTMSLEIFDIIQDGIDASNPVNLIEVMAGTYNENVDVNKSLTLQGEDKGTTEIKFGYGYYPSESPLTISADGVTVSGFTIRSGPYIEPAWTIVVEDDSALLTDLNVIKETCLHQLNGNPTNKGAAIGYIIPNIVGFTFTDSTVDSAWNGLYTREGSSNIIVQNVDFTYPGEYAIFLKTITGATIEGNTFICTSDKYGVIVTRGSDSIGIVSNEFVGSGLLAASHIGILLQAWVPFIMGDVDILNNEISSFNTGILVEDIDTSGIFIHYNNIFSNVMGVNNTATAGLDATNNWWGNANGPYHPITNPLSTGDTVSDNVGYIPWSDSPDF